MVAALELEDYSNGSDISDAEQVEEQVYYLEDQDIDDDIQEDDE